MVACPDCVTLRIWEGLVTVRKPAPRARAGAQLIWVKPGLSAVQGFRTEPALEGCLTNRRVFALVEASRSNDRV